MVAKIDGSGINTVGLINTGTTQNTTSGTYVDFTSIPSGVKRISIMFKGVSTNGTSPIMIQIGAGSFTTSGYYCNATGTNSSALTSITNTNGFAIADASRADFQTYGLFNLAGFSNFWAFSGGCYRGSEFPGYAGGGVTLSGTLDRVRITTVNGTDTFDAGSVNILYE